MSAIDLFHHSLTSWCHLQDSLAAFAGQLPLDHLILGQQIEDPNVLGKIQTWFQNFLSSGQAGAMAIGFIIGFAIRSLTAS